MKRKKLLPILQMLLPYLILPMFTNLFDGQSGAMYLKVYILLTVIVYISNILLACAHPNGRELAFWDMAIKLAHIPFFIGVFIVGLGVMIAIPLLFIVDAVLMLTSSVYGINALLKLRKQGLLSNRTTALHILLHLFFITDVVSTVIVNRKISSQCQQHI